MGLKWQILTYNVLKQENKRYNLYKKQKRDTYMNHIKKHITTGISSVLTNPAATPISVKRRSCTLYINMIVFKKLIQGNDKFFFKNNDIYLCSISKYILDRSHVLIWLSFIMKFASNDNSNNMNKHYHTVTAKDWLTCIRCQLLSNVYTIDNMRHIPWIRNSRLRFVLQLYRLNLLQKNVAYD